jgi:hypothetical protein
MCNPGVVVHYLACGQGGAFLHPTHWLADTRINVKWRAARPLVQTVAQTLPDGTPVYMRTFELKKDDATRQESANAVFPARSTCARLTWRNLLFVVINPRFAVFVGLLALFSAWLLHFGSVVLHTSLAELRALPLGQAIHSLARLLLVTPWPVLVIAGISAAFIYFADHRDWRRRVPVGAAHALAHVLAFLIILFTLARHLPASFARDLWIVLITALLCGLVNPTIMGCYL